MPAFAFTADSTTNQLTIVGHGLVTGDGPATPFNIGGALPTGTPPITALTDYWIIRDDADHIKLATLQANALAGVFIDITANGSGTNQLLLGLPYRRPRTYASGSQVKPQDFNAIFDSYVALWNLLTGQAQSVFSGTEFRAAVLSPTALSGAVNVDYNPTGLSTARIVRLSTTGLPPIGLGGLAGGTAGRVVTLINLGPDDITVSNENGGAQPANRFALPSATGFAFHAGASINLWYDGTSSRWRPVGSAL